MTKKGTFVQKDGRHIRFNRKDEREYLADFLGGYNSRRVGDKYIQPQYVGSWTSREKVEIVGLGPGSAGKARLPRNTGTLVPQQLQGSIMIRDVRYGSGVVNSLVRLRNIGVSTAQIRLTCKGSWEPQW